MTRLLLFVGITTVLAGQAPTELERHFQGRRGTVLLDMPGDESGVDVHAREATVSADVIRTRLAKYGTGLRRGQSASVTLVKVKGDHIEFQLDGGGFTDRQLIGLPGYDSVHWGTTEEERRLRSRISGTRDNKRRRQLQSDYDSLRRRRVRPMREKLEREQREQHGSRFNIRFASDRETARLTAEELTAILRPYIELR